MWHLIRGISICVDLQPVQTKLPTMKWKESVLASYPLQMGVIKGLSQLSHYSGTVGERICWHGGCQWWWWWWVQKSNTTPCKRTEFNSVSSRMLQDPVKMWQLGCHISSLNNCHDNKRLLSSTYARGWQSQAFVALGDMRRRPKQPPDLKHVPLKEPGDKHPGGAF